jgi:O-antigen/teichoic acid export membrane protein
MILSALVARNTIVQTVGKVISTFFGLFILAIIARYLGQFKFGQYTTIITYLTFFATLADFGLTLVTVQMISQPGADKKKILNNLFGFRIVSASILLAVGIIIVFFLPYNQAIKTGIVLASLSFLFISLNQIFVGLFQYHLAMQYVVLAELWGRFLLLVLVVIVWLYDLGLNSLLAATVVSSAMNFLLHYLYAKRFFLVKFVYDKLFWKNIILKSWPLALTIFFNLIYLKTDILILSLVKTQNEVGVYGAAYRVIDVLITIPFMFAGIILPILAGAWSRGEKEFYNRVIQRSFDAMAIFSLPLLAGSLIVSSKLMNLVAGEEFFLSGSLLPILVLASIFIFLGTIYAHAIIAIDKQKKIIPAYVFVAFTSLAGYMYFIPKFSYYGAAWMTVYSELAIAVSSYYIVWKYSKFIPNFTIFIKAFFSAVLMFAILKLFKNDSNIFVMISCGAVFYFFLLLILGAVDKAEFFSLLKNKQIK